MRFDGLAGNAGLKEALSLAFKENRLPHAIILEGPDGCGKHTLARILASAFVCTGQEPPCGVCSGCLKAKSGSHPDIFAASGGSAARSFHVETIRFLRSDAYVLPNEAPCKVYLLFRAETMSDQAQNALLKILEEPPERVVFILTCVSSSSLLPTIRSRAQIFTLSPVTEQEGVTFLRPLFPNISEERLREEVRLWGGNIGRTLSALQTEKTDEAVTLSSQIARGIMVSEEEELLRLTAPLLKNKDLFRSVLERLSLLFRDACALRAGGSALTNDESARLLSNALTRSRLLDLVEVTSDIRSGLDRNGNLALLVTAFCARLRTVAGR